MNFVIGIATLLLLLSLLLVVFRLLRGPSIADRAVAGDSVSLHVIGLIGLYSIASGQSILIDLVIVTAVFGFLSLTVIGVYVERGARGKTSVELEVDRSVRH